MAVYKAYIEYKDCLDNHRESLGESSNKDEVIDACISELYEREEFEKDEEEDECREALALRGYWTVPYVDTTVIIEEE